MAKKSIGILHYSAAPVIGGVEAVISAHARELARAGFPTSIITGRGQADAQPAGVAFSLLPLIDSGHPEILRTSAALEHGNLPTSFHGLVKRLEEQLEELLRPIDLLIVHNVLTKHFNLPLTAALFKRQESGALPEGIAWCHDFTWTSTHSRSKVQPGYPWDLLRTRLPGYLYATVSRQRQVELADLLKVAVDQIRVIYNGVDPETLLGLNPEASDLIIRMNLLESDPLIIMPVRVTQAKNVEYALRFLAALKEIGLHPKLILTGPPDPHDENSLHYYQGLRELRNDLGLEEDMHFVYESGPEEGKPYLVGPEIVSALIRISDFLFMPSHREGFGIPILEGGLSGIPVVSSPVPAALEIGQENIFHFELSEEPGLLAQRVKDWLDTNPTSRMKRKIRKQFTWPAIFTKEIEPLLRKYES